MDCCSGGEKCLLPSLLKQIEPMSNLRKTFIIVLQTALFVSSITAATAMERRREQFSKEPGHYIVPTVYSVPGIGEGFLLGVAVVNAHDSYTDYSAVMITGDVEGVALYAGDIHLINENLFVEFAATELSKLPIREYTGRGMTSGKDDYITLELEDLSAKATRFTGTFNNRMIEVYAGLAQFESRLSRILDHNGALIEEASGDKNEFNIYNIGITLDWTDDYQDPRKGIRYDLSRGGWDESSAGASEYYVVNHNLTAYLPIGRRSTWAFNYFRSDAYVTRPGDTDFASVEAQAGVDCDSPELSAENQALCTQAINNIIASNRYGTATNLGGISRLRSYPEGRFKGAHAIFYGTEFRWNLTEEFKPFNIGLAKDVRTGIQLAFFYETASVADVKDQLGDIWRDSYGMGIRIVTASGGVLRADVATGDEGTGTAILFEYPWESF